MEASLAERTIRVEHVAIDGSSTLLGGQMRARSFGPTIALSRRPQALLARDCAGHEGLLADFLCDELDWRLRWLGASAPQAWYRWRTRCDDDAGHTECTGTYGRGFGLRQLRVVGHAQTQSEPLLRAEYWRGTVPRIASAAAQAIR